MSDDPYVYPGTTVLRNKFSIRNARLLDRVERRFVVLRSEHGIPTGAFDLRHLQSVHRHLFQDIYEWAGEIRTVEIAKGDSRFVPLRYIGTGMAVVHRRLREEHFLCDLSRSKFPERAATIIGDINHVHPFREGNGRTQLQYLQQLAAQAGHELDLTRLDPATWLHASIEANAGRYEAMARCIEETLRGGLRP
jgi:cell filamentation protein